MFRPTCASGARSVREDAMSKYFPLWQEVARRMKEGEDKLTLTFADVQGVLGVEIDHSFLNCKKELEEYGCKVGKISLKEQKITFEKI